MGCVADRGEPSHTVRSIAEKTREQPAARKVLATHKQPSLLPVKFTIDSGLSPSTPI